MMGVATCCSARVHAERACACTLNVWTESKCWIEVLIKMSLCAYFQKMNKSCLPNPQGPLSKQLPSSCIESANNHVEEVTKQMTTEGAKGRKRGPYKKYTPNDKAEVANYATLHGTSAAIRHFKARFPDLKWTTVNDWKEAMIKATTKAAISRKFWTTKIWSYTVCGWVYLPKLNVLVYSLANSFENLKGHSKRYLVKVKAN